MGNGERCVYFDNAAAAPPDEAALEVFLRAAKRHYANTEAVHALAYAARGELTAAGRRLAAALLGKEECPVVWGGSATELFRVIASVPEFSSAAASALEHPALTANLKHFTRLTLLPADRRGTVRVEDADALPPLLAIHQVQSELGVIQPLASLFPASGASCRLCDAVQAAGKLPIFPAADAWVISGVKFGAPGGAALILSPSGRFTERILAHAEACRRRDYSVGRVNLPTILSMVAAAENAVAAMAENRAKAAEIHAFIRQGVAEAGIVPTLPEGADVSPYILHLMLPSQESAVVVRALGARGVYVASGSACSAESGEPSPALRALGISGARLYRALRLSFSGRNSMKDAEIFLSELKTVLKNY